MDSYLVAWFFGVIAFALAVLLTCEKSISKHWLKNFNWACRQWDEEKEKVKILKHRMKCMRLFGFKE
jgi:hypothetical protein